jgi:hypothetical protein
MNWRRGLLRLWIGLTGLWLVGVSYFCFIEFSKTGPFGGNFQHDYEMKADQPAHPSFIDWSDAFYEIFKSPSKEGLSPQFSRLEDQYFVDWERSVKEGNLIVVQFPDHARLYLSSQLTHDDQEYLAGTFYDQRWIRYVANISAWLSLAIGVPLAALCLGIGTLWVVQGFYSARS